VPILKENMYRKYEYKKDIFFTLRATGAPGQIGLKVVMLYMP